MRALAWAVAAAALFAFSLAPISSAATLDLTGLVGSRIAHGNAGVVSHTASFGTVRFEANPVGSDLTWSTGNGLGIDCPSTIRGCWFGNPYQIDTPEFLVMTFDRPTYLSSVDIGLLSSVGWGYLRLDEEGSIVGDGFSIGFDSDDARNGVLTVNVNRLVSSVRFVPDRGEWNDFSLARIRVNDDVAPPPSAPIPEPSSVVLLLVGGGIVASQLRRRI